MAAPDLVDPETARQEVNCRVCDSERYSAYLDGRGYRVVQCLGCGLWYVNPQPSIRELREFYAGFDRDSSWRGDGEEGFDRTIRNLVLRYQPRGSVLDIGSGRGNFLLAMDNAGFSVYGVEPSSKNSEFARSVNRIPTFTGTIEEFLAAPPRGGFQVVTLLNVLEHLRDPRGVLLGLKRVLSDEALVVIVVPDARLHALVGETRRKLGFSDPFWMDTQKHPLVGFDPPPHLCSFEPRTIRLLLERCGFRPLALRNAPVIFNQDTWKNAAKRALHACSETLYQLSGRRLVLGYSTAIVARRLA